MFLTVCYTICLDFSPSETKGKISRSCQNIHTIIYGNIYSTVSIY